MSETQEFHDTSISVMPAYVFAGCKFYDSNGSCHARPPTTESCLAVAFCNCYIYVYLWSLTIDRQSILEFRSVSHILRFCSPKEVISLIIKHLPRLESV